MLRKSVTLVLLGLTVFSTTSIADFQRGYVSIMGSSTVVPFAQAVADKISRGGRLHAPLIQSSGTGGGIKLMCDSLGAESPDIAIASREMKKKEKDECQKNGVDVFELKVGYDGLILVQSRRAEPWSLTGKETRLAFAKWIANGPQMDPNPNKTWHDVKPSLPATPIQVLGPPTTSATHDAFIDLISELECKHEPWVPAGASEPSADMLRKCRSVREDRVYQEGRENDLDQVSQIAASSGSELGILGYKIYMDNTSKVRAIPIDGVEPTYENISAGTYIGARPLYLYVKTANIGRTPGFKEFLSEFINENAWGDKGYLRKEGLVSMPSTERSSYTNKLAAFGILPATSGAPSAEKPASKSGKAIKKAKH